jgi:hypothetical protein
VLRAFVTWCLLPRLHRKAARGPLTAGSRNAAAASMTAARAFLAWLDERGRLLDQADRADIDTWQASRTGPDRARTFLTWAMWTGGCRDWRCRRCPGTGHLAHPARPC